MHLKAGFATAAEEEREETAALKIIKYDEVMYSMIILNRLLLEFTELCYYA